MNGLVFAPAHNTGRKRDATGAFIPEAKKFAEMHNGRLVLVDNRRPKGEMVNSVLTEIERAGAYHDGSCCADPDHDHRLEFVAFFCHGYPHGLQFGFNLRNVDRLGEAIASASNPEVIVPLYACSAASTLGWLRRRGLGPGGDRGFADELRDALCEHGATFATVDAHTTAGHTTWNPNVRRFAGDGSPVGGIGGSFIVERRTPLWRPWVRALRGDLRLRFPFMPIGMIHAELARDSGPR